MEDFRMHLPIYYDPAIGYRCVHGVGEGAQAAGNFARAMNLR
jgi:hypothetical protein